MPKCEKCGYKKANFKWCKRCGRTNPCPTKKRFLYIGLVIGGVALFVVAVGSAKWVANWRLQNAKAGVTTFAAPREPKAPGGGKGGRSGTISWR